MISNMSTTKAQTLPWQLPATPESKHAVTTRSDRPVGCRDYHITHAFDSSTRPSAPAGNWRKVDGDASDARASRAEMEADDSVMGYGLHWIYNSTRRSLTRYHRCTECNCLEATRHGTVIGKRYGNHHWNRIPFLSRLPLRRSVHGLDMSDEHPARSQRFSLLTWHVKYLHAWSPRDEHLHAKHARTDSKQPVFNPTTALTAKSTDYTSRSTYVALHHSEYHILSHPFIFNRLLFVYSKFPGNGCWSSAWNASSELFTPNFSHQPGAFPWMFQLPSLWSYLPIPNISKAVASFNFFHLNRAGKLSLKNTT